jgi:hypothetical protein
VRSAALQSGFHSARAVAARTRWSPEAIAERQAMIAKKAASIWPLLPR